MRSTSNLYYNSFWIFQIQIENSYSLIFKRYIQVSISMSSIQLRKLQVKSKTQIRLVRDAEIQHLKFRSEHKKMPKKSSGANQTSKFIEVVLCLITLGLSKFMLLLFRGSYSLFYFNFLNSDLKFQSKVKDAAIQYQYNIIQVCQRRAVKPQSLQHSCIAHYS